MINESFGDLNRKKLPFIFMVISAIFLFLVLSILLIVRLINKDHPDLKDFWMIILVAGIGMPVFLIALSYVVWHLNRRVRNKALRKEPFNQLHKIGFTTSYIDDTKWLFTEETMGIEIYGYTIQFNVNRDTPKTVEFTALVSHKGLDTGMIKRLEIEFKKENIHFDFDGIVKKYVLKKILNLTINQVETDLIRFVEKLKNEGFEPLNEIAD